MEVYDIPRYDFDADVRLYNLGDIHRADLLCDEKLLARVIDAIRVDPNARWVSTGDFLNVALKSSVSDVYASRTLNWEFDALSAELACIREKCLGVVSSNHHRRFDREVGMSLDALFCDKNQLPFLGKSAVINLTIGHAGYMVALHHGFGGGRERGGKANNLLKLRRLYPGCDLYLGGHHHSFDFFITTVNMVDRKRLNIVEHDAYFCCTGHFLNWKRSYAEDYAMEPASKGAAVLTLKHATTGNFDRKKITGDLFR